MNPLEYSRLEAIDREHWFYSGKRSIVRWWLQRCSNLGKDDLLVDAGVGTGVWLAEMGRICKVAGIEAANESFALAQDRVAEVGGTLYRGEMQRVPFADGSAAAVTMMDVLEHIDDDRSALQEMIRITKPGGILVITVPALMQLWSDWDVALHHRRRYTKRRLLEICDPGEVEVLHCAYFNCFALPAIALVRWGRKLWRSSGQRAEDRVPPAMLNHVLRKILVLSACTSWFRPPAGVSLLAILRRRNNGDLSNAGQGRSDRQPSPQAFSYV